jgi:3-oxoacyl-[acyl-carrier protein] reductase
MEQGLKNKVALITASSRGLGLACAKALANEGASVAICARDPKKLAEAEAEISKSGSRVYSTTCDLTKLQDTSRLFEQVLAHFGKIDILVFNHGHPPSGASFIETPPQHWRDTFAQSIESAVNLCQKIIPGMQQRQWGRIIFLNSISAKEPDTRYVVSSSVRPGLLGFAKCLSREFGSQGITVNSVLLGPFNTGLLHTLAEEEGRAAGTSREQVLKKWADSTPRHILGEPVELGNLVAFLSSPSASLINGTAIPADGGYLKSMMSELRGQGKLIVFIEHDIAAVRQIADQVIVMDEGKIIAQGKPAEVLERPEIIEAYVA